METVRPSTFTVKPKAASARSVWSRVQAGSVTDVVPSVWRPARMTALFTWALGTFGLNTMGWSVVPCTVSGAWPSTASMRAPISPSGSMTRRMGRRESDSSPIMVAVKGWAARIPASMRIVVPELPASSGSEVAEASSFYGDRVAVARDVDTESTQAVQRRGAVGAGRVVAQFRASLRERGQQRVAVGNGLVAGHSQSSLHARRRGNRHSRSHRHSDDLTTLGLT